MNIKDIKIGELNIKNNVFLAPMAGITDKAFRKICIDMGASLTYSEMISSKGVYYNDKKTLNLIEKNENEKPYAIQLFGNDPYIISEAIKRIEHLGDIIDINMGCPAPKITNNGEGSALMKNPKLIGKIVNMASKTTNKPVTVKIRKGWDDNSENAVEIAKIVEENGAKLITVHGRTRNEFYTGKSDLDIIKEVKQNVNIPVIGNGDIVDVSSANNMFNYTNVDGIMIGRGTLGNPWIFKQLINNDNNEISKKDKLDMILHHYDLEIQNKGEYTAIREMRKHICWYIKGLKNNTYIKDIINRLENIDEIKKVLIEYLEN